MSKKEKTVANTTNSYVFYKSESGEKWHRKERCAREALSDEYDMLAVSGGADINPAGLEMARGDEIAPNPELCGRCVDAKSKRGFNNE